MTLPRLENPRIRTGKMMALVNAIMLAGAAAAQAASPSTSSSASSASTSDAASSASGTGTGDNGKKKKDEKKNDASLDEVVVTAKPAGGYKADNLESGKYTEPVNNIPQTVIVVPKQVWQDQGQSSLREVLQNVPGVTVTAGEGGNLSGDNISIRGFNARRDIFVDGMRDAGVYNRDAFNLDQVEVIKGPGSTYSGNGSTGGSVGLDSKQAHLGNSYEGSVGFGTDQYYRQTVDLNQTLPDLSQDDGLKGVALRVNAMHQYNQFANRNTIDADRWGVAPTVTLGLGTDQRETFSYFHQQENNLPGYGIPAIAGGGLAPVPYANFYGFANLDHEQTYTDMGTFKVEHDFADDLKVTNTARYSRGFRNSLVTSMAGANLAAGTVTQQYFGRRQSDELWGDTLLVSKKDEIFGMDNDFAGTLEFSREQSLYSQRVGNQTGSSLYVINPYAAPTAIFPDYGAKTYSQGDDFAFSLFDTIKPVHWLEFTGGMRFDAYEQYSHTYNAVPLQREDLLPSWRVGAVYHPREEGSVYFGYGTSFNPSIAGVNNGQSADGLAATTNTVAPEENESYELGTKWGLLKKKLNLSLALFRSNKTNARIDDPTIPGTTYVMSGIQRAQGIELGLQGDITEQWKVFAGYTYQESEVLKSYNQLELGYQLPNTPEQSGNVWTTYDLTKQLTVGTGFNYMDRRYTSSTYGSRSVAPDYWLQSLMASYKVSENVTVQMNVANLWDEEYIDRVGGARMQPGTGRSVIFSTNFKF